MEFLKSCNSNAQAIGDFEAVAFQAFSVARSPTHAASRPPEWNTNEDIRAAEAELRREQHLVIQDASRPWLWLFRATAADQANQKPLDLPAVDGYRFQREHYGVMKASELARPPLRNNNNPNPNASTNSPLTPGSSKGFQAGGARLPQGYPHSHVGPDPQQHNDSFAIYELFTSSVVALISYYLVKDHNAVALNYRTFVSKPTVHQDASEEECESFPVPYWLTNLDVYWASSGTLVVSTYSLLKPEVHCLSDVIDEDEQKGLIGSCVRVAPNGMLAQVASFDDPLDAASEDNAQMVRRKRAKIGPVEQGLDRWKSAVKRWITWKGYSTPDLAESSSWVRIRVAQTNQLWLSSPAPFKHFRDILWPRALCFYYKSSVRGIGLLPPEGSATTQGDKALEWFEIPFVSTGFRDPVDVAQQWFMGKPERDNILEARRRAKKIEEDAARAKEENHGLFPSSPLNSRTGAYGDLQAVSGVYPTPPDGILPGTAVSSSDTPNVSGTANMILPPGGNNPAINLLGPQESLQTDANHLPLTFPDLPMPFDQYHSGGGNDDLFEDMDEDDFGGNGITDADFEFFDEPDGEDVDMLDASNPEDSKPAPKKKSEQDTAIVPETPIKEETPDPMTALENALAKDSAPTEEDMQDIKTERHADLSADPGQTETRPSQPVMGSQVVSAVSKEPTPPLSPKYIEKTLLPSPKGNVAPETPQTHMIGRHADSIFDPLSFSRKMSLSDAKYQEGRFSLAAEKTSKRKKGAQTVTPKPKSLRDLPLLTKLRYAIGVASNKGIPEVSSLARGDSDSSDISSETSSVIDDGDDDVASVSIRSGPLSADLSIPAKRKLPMDGNATPLSATSFADSLGGDFQEIAGLQIDETSLVSLEPNSADWPLINVPPPIELPATGTRFSIPSFSPIVSSVPSTPTSQQELSFESPDEKPLSGKDSIAVAQIVTEQIVSATLDILQECPTPGADVVPYRSPSETKWQGAIKAIFPYAADCNVTALASIHDVLPDLPSQAKGPQRPPPRKPNEGQAVLGHSMHQISPPFIRVRRADILWDLLPPALAFWEPLGLAPCSAPKNVVAFCIYPHSDSLRPCIENFLLNVQLAYDSCRLGGHTRVETVPEYEGGLVPCKISTPASARTAFKALRTTCIQLGKLLAVKHAQMRDKDESKIDAFVIYMIDPFGKSSALWELCSAFWTLFQAYGQGTPGRPDQVQKPDLVLQIVPIKYVASFEVPVILDSSTYTSLAREVYDRCPPSAPSEDKTPLSIYAAPSFQLEEAIPRQIPFKLQSEPPQDLLRENSYLHLGYAISLDGTWITAAWTDNCGKSKAVVSYKLGTRVFAEIASEIWKTTIEILQARNIQWRVCITKAGVMDREEMETWVYLVGCPSPLHLFVTLLTVDTDPRLKFTPTIPPTNSSAIPSSAGHPAGNSPSSTPQAGVSPEHGLTPAATPSAETATDPTSDPEARLLDTTDETWGIILAHRLHNSNSTTEFRPALISALLVKRGAPTSTPPSTLIELGPIIIGVNILWMGAINPSRAATSPFPPSAPTDGISPGAATTPGPGPGPQERSYTSLTWTPTAQTRAAAENLLKEVLGQFRGLGLLARLKGMRGTRGGAVPWHVVAALRGCEGVGACVPGG